MFTPKESWTSTLTSQWRTVWMWDLISLWKVSRSSTIYMTGRDLTSTFITRPPSMLSFPVTTRPKLSSPRTSSVTYMYRESIVRGCFPHHSSITFRRVWLVRSWTFSTLQSLVSHGLRLSRSELVFNRCTTRYDHQGTTTGLSKGSRVSGQVEFQVMSSSVSACMCSL